MTQRPRRRGVAPSARIKTLKMLAPVGASTHRGGQSSRRPKKKTTLPPRLTTTTRRMRRRTRTRTTRTTRPSRTTTTRPTPPPPPRRKRKRRKRRKLRATPPRPETLSGCVWHEASTTHLVECSRSCRGLLFATSSLLGTRRLLPPSRRLGPLCVLSRRAQGLSLACSSIPGLVITSEHLASAACALPQIIIIIIISPAAPSPGAQASRMHSRSQTWGRAKDAI
mmetsp:Transcript_21507/g.67472  ORF Transcript_21507/g.67472 Transcript_21507/m.67472 type:complete len:224 (+) Transcript_21507:791-1462(+)